MTTNKQLRKLAEKAGSGDWYESGELHYHDDRSGEAHRLHSDEDGFIAAISPATVLALLDAYEALQAECDLLRKHLQNLIDQTTPLEPVPGNPMWSRRIQLDAVIAERDQLRAECEKLRKDVERYWWLRRGGSDDIGVVRGFDGIDCGSTSVAYTYEEGLRGNRLDAAIDTAMEIHK